MILQDVDANVLDVADTVHKGRLTSADLVFNGPANNAVNRALIAGKKQAAQDKAIEAALEKKGKSRSI